MLGAIAGDIIGSAYRRRGLLRTDFPILTAASRFTGGTVQTVAVAQALMAGAPYGDVLRTMALRYPEAGYGPAFRRWLTDPDGRPGASRGSGAARRVAPVAFAFRSLDVTLAEARRSAEPTHALGAGIRGAQAVAVAVFLARTGESKQMIREVVTARFGYDLSRAMTVLRSARRFDASCDSSVPEALIAFLESDSVEGAIRLAVSLGGDADAQASIAGAVAEAYFGVVPGWLAVEVFERIPPALHAVVREFVSRFAIRRSASAISRE